MALFRLPHLPQDLLPDSLQNQPRPIPIMVGQYDELRNPTDVWNVLDNEMRPALPCVITLALDPYQPIVGPLVRTRELRFGASSVPPLQQLDEPADAERFWTIGGTVRSDHPLESVNLTLIERDLEVSLQPEGRFVIGPLEAGEYTLATSIEGRKPRHFKITVPAPDYDLVV